MALRIPDDVINATKKTVDLAAKPLTALREFFSTFDPQQKNQFIAIILPEVLPSNTTFADRAKVIARSVFDATMFEFHIQNLDIPVNGIDYTRYDHLQAAQDITWADEVTVSFIENELSAVRTFLQNWMSLSFERNLTYPKGGYVFNDNQYLARKKIIIMPQSRTGIPNTVWIEIRGARFKSMENFTFDQQSPDPMMISVTMAVDGVYLNSLI